MPTEEIFTTPKKGMAEGKLVSTEKVRGRKQALRVLVDKAVENIEDPNEAPGYVVHADAEADALRLMEMLKAKFPTMDIRLSNVGPVIGAHSGPGTMALFFLGKER